MPENVVMDSRLRLLAIALSDRNIIVSTHKTKQLNVSGATSVVVYMNYLNCYRAAKVPES
jgi:hypothetical protein